MGNVIIEQLHLGNREPKRHCIDCGKPLPRRKQTPAVRCHKCSGIYNLQFSSTHKRRLTNE